MSVIASCENVHKTYLLGAEGVAALRGIALDVREGELLLIYGTSGGGKSTMLHILGTIDLPTKGNLTLFDTRVTTTTADDVLAALRCEKMGFVFQSFNLIGTMTAGENVALPMRLRGILSPADIDARVEGLLAEVGLGERRDHLPSMLSGGEQQRVAMARALANEPRLVLLDEPTGDLDTKNARAVMRLLQRLRRARGVTMVMVTHDERWRGLADRVVLLRDGKVQRIEVVGEEVRRAAEKTLEEQEEGMVPAEERSRGLRVVRDARHYQTFRAQRALSSMSEEGISSAVRLLFAPCPGVNAWEGPSDEQEMQAIPVKALDQV